MLVLGLCVSITLSLPLSVHACSDALRLAREGSLPSHFTVLCAQQNKRNLWESKGTSDGVIMKWELRECRVWEQDESKETDGSYLAGNKILLQAQLLQADQPLLSH